MLEGRRYFVQVTRTTVGPISVVGVSTDTLGARNESDTTEDDTVPLLIGKVPNFSRIFLQKNVHPILAPANLNAHRGHP